MVELVPLYYLGNLLSDEIVEGGTCSFKVQRLLNKLLIKYISKKAFLIFFSFCVLNLRSIVSRIPKFDFRTSVGSRDIVILVYVDIHVLLREYSVYYI